MSAPQVGEIVVNVLKLLVSEVGIEGIVKLIMEIGGPDRVKAALDAEYLATDLAVDVAETEKLEKETLP